MKILSWLIKDSTVMFVIVIATIALVQLSGGGSPKGHWLVIDYACIVFFVVEAILKIYKFGIRGYLKDPWNAFDFLVVLISAPMLITPFMDMPDYSGLLVLRLGRLFRTFRMLRFIPEREQLVSGIKRALRASVGVFIAVVLANFILAMIAMMLFATTAPEFFSTPLKSCYTMFQVFTLEGWNHIPDIIAARLDNPIEAGFARLYFVISVFVGGIIGLSLVNAVFVDQMVLDNNDNIEKKIDQLSRDLSELANFIGDSKQK